MSVRFFISRELTGEQKERLRKAGVEFLGLPLIKTLPVEFDAPSVSSFNPHFAVFSSKNGVRFFFNRFPPERLRGIKVVAVGSSTARELMKLGFSPLVPENFSAEGIVELFREADLKGMRFLIVRPRKARSLLREFLEGKGAQVLELVVYQTVPDREAGREVREFFSRRVDYAAFTSPSNFKSFLDVVPEGRELLKGVGLIPIGHVTLKAIEKEGFSPLSPPSQYTVDGIIGELLSLEKLS